MLYAIADRMTPLTDPTDQRLSRDARRILARAGGTGKLVIGARVEIRDSADMDTATVVVTRSAPSSRGGVQEYTQSAYGEGHSPWMGAAELDSTQGSWRASRVERTVGQLRRGLIATGVGVAALFAAGTLMSGQDGGEQAGMPTAPVSVEFAQPAPDVQTLVAQQTSGNPRG